MAKNILSGNFITRLFQPTETTYLHKGELLIVFFIGYLIAISLWLLVNLGRDYNLSMEVPLRYVGQDDDMVFAEQPPDKARIGVSGEGWNLISLYRNPPEIVVAYDNNVVNITNVVKDQMAAFPDITIQEVRPSSITFDMVPKVSKRVPVSTNLDVRLKSQHEIIGDIRIRPDSVTVTGAVTVLDTLESWPTRLLQLRNVHDRVNQNVQLAATQENISLDRSEVQITFDVAEFTEGEARIYVRALNVPDNIAIRFNPSVITVRYDVPIESFSEAQELTPYEAIVDYDLILQDTTGSVIPTVRSTSDELNLRLRSFQPRRISYFRVVGNQGR